MTNFCARDRRFGGCQFGDLCIIIGAIGAKEPTSRRNYAKLGATCYGFYPLQLPEDIDFANLFHGDNERIPEAGFHWGIRTLTDMLRRFLVTG